MAKMGGAGVLETVAKMGGAHLGQNGRNSLWQKWVELTKTKMIFALTLFVSYPLAMSLLEGSIFPPLRIS